MSHEVTFALPLSSRIEFSIHFARLVNHNLEQWAKVRTWYSTQQAAQSMSKNNTTVQGTGSLWSVCVRTLNVIRVRWPPFCWAKQSQFVFKKFRSKLWLYKNNQEVEKYVIKCAKNTIKHGISYTGNDVIWSILTVSSELRLATAGAGCRWNRSVLVLEIFLAYQSSAFPSTTPIRFYVRISEFSSHELQNWGEGFTPGLDGRILIFCFCHLAVSKQNSGCDVTQW